MPKTSLLPGLFLKYRFVSNFTHGTILTLQEASTSHHKLVRSATSFLHKLAKYSRDEQHDVG